MSKKKHKKKHQKGDYKNGIFDVSAGKSKKDLNKDFKRTLKDIEEMQISLYEADKKQNRKERKKINKKEAEFYTGMSSIKCRKKIAKKWEKRGFLDYVIELLHQISPLVQILAKAVCVLIISFLSVDAIKLAISPNTLNKLAKLFDIAISV